MQAGDGRLATSPRPSRSDVILGFDGKNHNRLISGRSSPMGGPLRRGYDQALKNAVRETVKFLVLEKGLNNADAYALASIAVDYKIAEAVDQVQVVVGMIPKNIFKNNPQYWYKN
jgi:acetamidase/formamidase